MKLKDLKPNDYFTISHASSIYRLLSFEMEGVKCVTIYGAVDYFSYSSDVEFLFSRLP